MEPRAPVVRAADAKLASYLPRNLVEQLRSGQGEWQLAEFRNLSVVFGLISVRSTPLASRTFRPAWRTALARSAQAIEVKDGRSHLSVLDG